MQVKTLLSGVSISNAEQLYTMLNDAEIQYSDLVDPNQVQSLLPYLWLSQIELLSCEAKLVSMPPCASGAPGEGAGSAKKTLVNCYGVKSYWLSQIEEIEEIS